MYINNGVTYRQINYGLAASVVIITGYKAKALPSNIVIPETINGHPVTEVSFAAFSGAELETIDIPDSVWYISKDAFRNCPKLKQVRFYRSKRGNSKNFVKIATGAFANCTELYEFASRIKLNRVGTKCFENCSKLKFLDAPIENLQGLALENCAELQSLLFTDKCEIASTALKGCKKLEVLVFEGDISTGVADSTIAQIKKKHIMCWKPESNLMDFAYTGTKVELLEMP